MTSDQYLISCDSWQSGWRAISERRGHQQKHTPTYCWPKKSKSTPVTLTIHISTNQQVLCDISIFSLTLMLSIYYKLSHCCLFLNMGYKCSFAFEFWHNIKKGLNQLATLFWFCVGVLYSFSNRKLGEGTLKRLSGGLKAPFWISWILLNILYRFLLCHRWREDFSSYLHHEDNGVEGDHCQHGVLKQGRYHKVPQAVL